MKFTIENLKEMSKAPKDIFEKYAILDTIEMFDRFGEIDAIIFIRRTIQSKDNNGSMFRYGRYFAYEDAVDTRLIKAMEESNGSIKVPDWDMKKDPTVKKNKSKIALLNWAYREAMWELAIQFGRRIV